MENKVVSLSLKPYFLWIFMGEPNHRQPLKGILFPLQKHRCIEGSTQNHEGSRNLNMAIGMTASCLRSDKDPQSSLVNKQTEEAGQLTSATISSAHTLEWWRWDDLMLGHRKHRPRTLSHRWDWGLIEKWLSLWGREMLYTFPTLHFWVTIDYFAPILNFIDGLGRSRWFTSNLLFSR